MYGKEQKVGDAEKNQSYSFSKSQIYRIYQIAMSGKLAIGDGVLWTCKRGAAERSLETAAAKAMSLGSVVASHHRRLQRDGSFAIKNVVVIYFSGC